MRTRVLRAVFICEDVIAKKVLLPKGVIHHMISNNCVKDALENLPVGSFLQTINADFLPESLLFQYYLKCRFYEISFCQTAGVELVYKYYINCIRKTTV